MRQKKEKIWLSSPHLGQTEQQHVQSAFAQNWIAPLGPHVNSFEEDICQFTGAQHAAALSSGTAAIHLALELLDTGPGDVVFVSSFTFSATVNPILYQGALPVLIDSEPHTWNMDPKALEQAIRAIQSGALQLHLQNPKLLAKLPWLSPNFQPSTFNLQLHPKAILPVHLYGMPANMDAIQEIAVKYDLPIIEDAAEALGSTYKGQHCGTFGKLGIYSFNGNKIITTGGGGALVSDDEALIKKARFLATQARDDAPHYQHSHIGYNYRLSNISAAIGRGQMEVLPQRVAQRRQNFAFYKNALADLPGVSFLTEPSPDYFSNHWLTTLLIDPEESGGVTRETVRTTLQDHNIDSRPLWKPMHLQPVFEDLPFFGDGFALPSDSRRSGLSDHLFDIGLCLPSGSNLTEADLDRIVGLVRGCWK